MSTDHLDALLEGDAALEAIASVRRACREHDGTDPLDEAASIRLARHGLAQWHAWVRPDGFALRGQAPGDGERLDLAVAPDRRGRGVGGALADAALASSTGVGGGSSPLGAWSHGDHPAAAALAARHGLERVRELWVLRRPTSTPVDDAPPPAGVRIRDYGATDAAAVLSVNAAAFAHHPEQGAMDADDLEARMAEAWFDPAGLLLAVDDAGRLLGFHWTKQHDDRTGEVYVVAVSPDAQGRGLGRVLTAAGLQHLAARGVGEVILYVESDNTAAVRLYTGLGFTHDARDTHVQYRR
ncbi:mycothiol synthase [Nocardioides sp.]|uniref:mycothiol synthase n=1 Tax=Nocardioides sp. TaxID=35761 RepID=UPI00351635ED